MEGNVGASIGLYEDFQHTASISASNVFSGPGHVDEQRRHAGVDLGVDTHDLRDDALP